MRVQAEDPAKDSSQTRFIFEPTAVLRLILEDDRKRAIPFKDDGRSRIGRLCFVAQPRPKTRPKMPFKIAGRNLISNN